MGEKATFGDRLRLLMEERRLSYEQLGRLLHMRPQTLNRYVLGQREPKAAVATEMALALGVDPLWLQGYEVPRPPRPQRPAGMVPILGVIRAGKPVLADGHVEGYAAADVPDPDNCFYLRVRGDSMVNAGIRDGDLVLLRRSDRAENGDIVACMVDGEDATLKRFRRQGDLVILQAENPRYEPRVIPVEDFASGRARVVGVALRLVRSLDRIW